ncbi:Biotin carboxyl carrier protein of acetyl-CoA carboxylase [Senna tora]|uniref:Biotin carboxyl carrier protein of acetyl-CoA carboxylase n=1 Tax=Senna tora TaxID=362788 RepID=A0A834WAU7_9FABA|nr:Biotin carboxyl carrier protein of acetyl-CoA carboxylase [Senna tora]
MLHIRSSLEKPCVVPMHNTMWNSQSRLFFQRLENGEKHISSQTKWKRTLVSCAKTTEPIKTKSDASSGSSPQDSLEKKPLKATTFPNGFEALLLEVCDETEIAELKVKVGEFELNLKRNIGATTAPLSNISPVTPPPIPTKPMVESGPASPPPPPPPKSSSEKVNPFINVSLEKSSKLAALEASGNNNYVLVSSPTVGSFRRGRTVKGKKQPPICKQGDVIKEGQVIGYLDQFGTELPVKSDVAGEVLKLLFEDGEAVGYGDPLIAVLPSFHDINIIQDVPINEDTHRTGCFIKDPCVYPLDGSVYYPNPAIYLPLLVKRHDQNISSPIKGYPANIVIYCVEIGD